MGEREIENNIVGGLIIVLIIERKIRSNMGGTTLRERERVLDGTVR
jgi:hypothetical protein